MVNSVYYGVAHTDQMTRNIILSDLIAYVQSYFSMIKLYLILKMQRCKDWQSTTGTNTAKFYNKEFCNNSILCT